MGGADDADVDALGDGGADGHHLLRLDHPQELRLRLGGHVADLVEEEGAAVGRADDAHLVAVGAGEGAALVAEELALQEVGGDGRAVDRLKGTAAQAPLVELAGEDLLPGPALAEQDDAQLGAGDALEGGGEPVDLVAADDGAAAGDGIHLLARQGRRGGCRRCGSARSSRRRR